MTALARAVAGDRFGQHDRLGVASATRSTVAGLEQEVVRGMAALALDACVKIGFGSSFLMTAAAASGARVGFRRGRVRIVTADAGIAALHTAGRTLMRVAAQPFVGGLARIEERHFVHGHRRPIDRRGIGRQCRMGGDRRSAEDEQSPSHRHLLSTANKGESALVLQCAT